MAQLTLNPVDPKDPSDVKIYTMDWTSGLNTSATISTSSWTVPTGITNVTDSIVTGSLKTSIKLSGGTDGADYVVTNTVVTSDGETLERSGTVCVRNL